MAVDFEYITNFNVKDIKKNYDDEKIKIPKYQRMVKWDLQRKKNLIESLKAGNPMGAILIRKDIDNSFEIIDGLQRISTIVHYYENPNIYITSKDIPIELCQKIEPFLHTKFNKHQIAEVIVKEMQHFSGDLKLSEKYEKIINALPVEQNNKSNLKDVLLDSDIEKISSQIDEYPVILINYKGDREKLPVIFYALNTGAQNLTKYEVISSQWNDKKLIFTTKSNIPSVLNPLIVEKYNIMREKGYEFDFEGEETSNEFIYLFDFCEALSIKLSSKKIIRHSNILFAKNEDRAIGFDILSLLFHGIQTPEKACISLAQPNYIEIILNESTNSNELEKLYNAIIDVAEKINAILEEYIFMSPKMSNTLLSGYNAKYLFKYVFNKKYSIKFENGSFEIENIKYNINKIEHNIILNIIYDVITEFWPRNRQLSDFIFQIENNLNRYDNIPSIETFVNEFATFLKDSIEEKSVKYSSNTITEDVKILSYFMHSSLFNMDQKYREYYSNKLDIEFDHYYAKSNFNKAMGVGHSSLLNIHPIPKKDNNQKKDKDVTNTKNTNYVSNEKYNEILKRDKQDINFKNFTKEDKIQSFQRFCNDYQNTLGIRMKKIYKNISTKY